MADTLLVSPSRTLSTRKASWLDRPAEWMWAIVVLAQVGVAALLTSYTYFFVDDFLFLRQAQTSPLSLGYLGNGLFQHFSPDTRLLNKLVVLLLSPGSFAVAHTMQLALYAAVVAAFALVVRQILGRTWTALLLTVLFGQSLFLMRLLTWWTATANILPASIFALVAMLAYLRWIGGASSWWLAGAWAGLAIALADYETAMLFPVCLLLIRLLVMNDSFDPREWARIIWRERAIWAGFVVLDLSQLINYYLNYYVRDPSPTLGQDLHFVFTASLQGFMPGIFGYKRYPTVPGLPVVVWAGFAFCLLWALLIAWRPRAWRCLLVWAIIFLLEMMPLGLTRIALFGVDIGADLYYQQSVQFFFLILVAFALTPRWGGERAGPIGLGRAHRAIPRERRSLALGGAIMAGLATYGILYVVSARQIGTPAAALAPRQTKSYVSRFRRSATSFTARTGSAPNLVNAALPTNLMPTSYVPFNQYDQFLHLVDSRVVYNRWSEPSFVLSPDGALRNVSLSTVATAGPLQATVSVSPATVGVRASRSPLAACTHGAGEWLQFGFPRLPRLRSGRSTLMYEVGVRFTMATKSNVTVLANTTTGQVPADFDPHTWGPGQGSQLARLMPGVQPDRILLEVPGGTCVQRVSVIAVRL